MRALMMVLAVNSSVSKRRKASCKLAPPVTAPWFSSRTQLNLQHPGRGDGYRRDKPAPFARSAREASIHDRLPVDYRSGRVNTLWLMANWYYSKRARTPLGLSGTRIYPTEPISYRGSNLSPFLRISWNQMPGGGGNPPPAWRQSASQRARAPLGLIRRGRRKG